MLICTVLLKMPGCSSDSGAECSGQEAVMCYYQTGERCCVVEATRKCAGASFIEKKVNPFALFHERAWMSFIQETLRHEEKTVRVNSARGPMPVSFMKPASDGPGCADYALLQKTFKRGHPTSQTLRVFRGIIRKYYQNNGRLLPWRGTTDPYEILVSEFMLDHQ